MLKLLGAKADADECAWRSTYSNLTPPDDLRVDPQIAREVRPRCGVVQDGTPCYADPHGGYAWFIDSNGWLEGYDSESDDYVQNGNGGGMLHGQVLTMQLDCDAGTLRFWLDGEPYGRGFTAGVHAHPIDTDTDEESEGGNTTCSPPGMVGLRWAISVGDEGVSALIVPTPLLQDAG